MLAGEKTSAQDLVARAEQPAGWNARSREQFIATMLGHLDMQAGWNGPRTAWGHPNFEGIWTSDDMRGVPMQRPEPLGPRQFLTEEEMNSRPTKCSSTPAMKAISVFVTF